MQHLSVDNSDLSSSLPPRYRMRMLFMMSLSAVFAVVACGHEKAKRLVASSAVSPAGGAVDQVLSAQDILLATNASGLWRSEDEGNSWRLALVAKPSDDDNADATFPGRVKTCGAMIFVEQDAADTTLVERSRDGGRSWENVDGEHFPQHCSEGLLIDGASESLYASVDQGSTWRRIVVPREVAGADLDIETFVLNDSTIYIGKPERAVVSVDTGAHWYLLPGAAVGGRTTVMAASGNTLWALPLEYPRGSGSGRVAVSRDYGQTWVQVGPDTLQKALMLLDEAVLRALPGGRIVIAPPSGPGVFALGTLEGGWEIRSARPGALAATPTVEYNQFLFGPSAHGPLRSKDGGKTWEVAAQGMIDPPLQIVRIGDVLYALGRHQLYRRTATGGRWEADVAIPVGEYEEESEIWADGLFVHDGELFVEADNIYYRRPEETAWQQISGVPTTPVQSSTSEFVIGAAGPSLILAENIESRIGSGWVRLYRREARSSKWERTGEFPDTRVEGFLTDTLAQSPIVYGASSQGVLRSSDAGKTWTSLSGMERDTRALVRSGTRLYGGTVDAGIVWLDLRADSGAWHVPGGQRLRGDVTAMWASPAHVERLVVGTTSGLFWSNDSGNTFSPVVFAGAATPKENSPEVYGILENGDSLLASTSRGLFQLSSDIPSPPGAASFVVGLWEQFWAQGPVAKLVGFLLSILAAYVLGVIALFASAWRRGSRVFSGSWLRGRAADVLLKVPALTRRILFLGYSRRLLKNSEVVNAGADYFGLPACTNSGNDLLPAPDGSTLHEAIASTLAARRPVLLVGPGGAGKTRVLARLAYLGAKRSLPDGLGDFVPVLVPASQWDGDFVSTIATVLLHRYGVQTTRETFLAQLEAGRILVLFDGVSELNVPDQKSALKSMLEVATSEEYSGCRFLFSSRPMLDPPEDIAAIELRPLTPENLSYVLPRYGLDPLREAHVRKQLEGFGRHAIEPLLFHMAVEDSRADEVSTTRSALYERYFRKLLKISDAKASFAWAGWRYALMRIGEWTLLEPGARGRGLTHDEMISRLNHPGPDADETSIPEQIRTKYDVDVGGTNPAVRLLQRLIEAGLLSGEPGSAWRFTHDTFEEYFAALRLVSLIELKGQWPTLGAWIGEPTREHAFEGVIRFTAEVLTPKARNVPLPLSFPEGWRRILADSRG